MAYYFMGSGQQPVNSGHLGSNFNGFGQNQGPRLHHPQHHRMQPKNWSLNSWASGYQKMRYHPGRPN